MTPFLLSYQDQPPPAEASTVQIATCGQLGHHSATLMVTLATTGTSSKTLGKNVLREQGPPFALPVPQIPIALSLSLSLLLLFPPKMFRLTIFFKAAPGLCHLTFLPARSRWL